MISWTRKTSDSCEIYNEWLIKPGKLEDHGHVSLSEYESERLKFLRNLLLSSEVSGQKNPKSESPVELRIGLEKPEGEIYESGQKNLRFYRARYQSKKT